MRTGSHAVKWGAWMRTRLSVPLQAFLTATLGFMLVLGSSPAAAAPPPAPVVVTPVNGSQISNPQPAVSGTAVVSVSVTVYLDGSRGRSLPTPLGIGSLLQQSL